MDKLTSFSDFAQKVEGDEFIDNLMNSKLENLAKTIKKLRQVRKT